MSLIFDVTLIVILITITSVAVLSQIKNKKLFKFWLMSLISLINFVFGSYLWLKNRLILDYGYEEEKVSSFANVFIELGVFIMLISLVGYIVWYVLYLKSSK